MLGAAVTLTLDDGSVAPGLVLGGGDSPDDGPRAKADIIYVDGNGKLQTLKGVPHRDQVPPGPYYLDPDQA